MKRIAAVVAVACFWIGFSIPVGGCLSSSQASAMTGAFSTCAKADFNQAIAPTGPLSGFTGAGLLAFVEEIVAANAAALEAELDAVIVVVGLDAVDCAIAAIEAIDNAPQSAAGAPAAVVIASVRGPGLGRARAHVNALRVAAKK